MQLNCTPFVRQYGILKNEWGVCYAKRSAKQKVYARIQETSGRNNVRRRTELQRNRETI